MHQLNEAIFQGLKDLAQIIPASMPMIKECPSSMPNGTVFEASDLGGIPKEDELYQPNPEAKL